MKFLFLDIDGVLNHQKFYERRYELIKSGKKLDYPYSEIDSVSVGYLNEIILRTEARIVVSSSWRYDPKLQDTFNKVGILSPIFGRTPYSDSRHRGTEVKMWLDQNSKQYHIDSYCIVDDDTDMLPEQLSKFVHTNAYEDGLNKDCMEQIIRILNG